MYEKPKCIMPTSPLVASQNHPLVYLPSNHPSQLEERQENGPQPDSMMAWGGRSRGGTPHKRGGDFSSRGIGMSSCPTWARSAAIFDAHLDAEQERPSCVASVSQGTRTDKTKKRMPTAASRSQEEAFAHSRQLFASSRHGRGAFRDSEKNDSGMDLVLPCRSLSRSPAVTPSRPDLVNHGEGTPGLGPAAVEGKLRL